MNETANAATMAAQRRVKVVRVSWLLGALVASAGVAAVVASFLFTTAVLNNDLKAQIRRATGLVTTIHGSAHFALFPRPHINIDNISFANPAAGLRIDAEGFTGALRLLPLLAGHAEVGHAVLYRPKMVIDLDARPVTPDSAIGRAAKAKSASPEAAATDSARLAVIDLVGGSARLVRHGGGDLFVDNINLSIDWRSLDASATVSGEFAFRTVPMQLSLWLAQPVELLRGGQSSATVRLDSTALKFLASGDISAGQQFQYKGSLVASAPSLRKAVELAGLGFAKQGRYANLDLRCDANLVGNTAALTNLHLSLDGNDYEGTLAVQSDAGTASLSGTLATNLLDLSPFLQGLPPLRVGHGRWNDAPLDLASLRFTNLDLRLSATHMRLGDMKIDDAAVSVLTRPGFLDLSLAEAVADGGALRGHLTLSARGKLLDLRSSSSVAGLDVRSLLHDHDGKHPLQGTLTSSIAVESTGASVDQLMQGLSGKAQIHLTNGQIVGVDLASALRNGTLQLRTPPGGTAARVTNFDTANFDLRIAKGIADIVDGRLHGDGLAIGFGGSADLGGRDLDLWARARTLVTPGDATLPGPPLWLGLKGPWDDLHVVTDQPPRNLPPPPAGSPPADAAGSAAPAK